MRTIWQTLVVALGLVSSCASAAQAQGEITIGYQLMYNPWKVAIANGAIEQATASEITWRRFDSGAKVINAMASGAVQVAQSGSSPIAAGISRGLDIEVVWPRAGDLASRTEQFTGLTLDWRVEIREDEGRSPSSARRRRPRSPAAW